MTDFICFFKRLVVRGGWESPFEDCATNQPQNRPKQKQNKTDSVQARVGGSSWFLVRTNTENENKTKQMRSSWVVGPWTVHGQSMNGPWTVHGQSMDSPWTVHGEVIAVARLAKKTVV